MLLGANGRPKSRATSATVKSFKWCRPVYLPWCDARPRRRQVISVFDARAGALLVVPSPFFILHRQRIGDLAARHRLPAMYPDRPDVEAGGLMAYAVDELETARRVAAYVDRILKGAKPGNLPVKQPTGFKLILNLKTAQALGLTIPPEVLIQAEEVMR